MTPLVVDASVAIKWVIGEPGSTEAVALRETARLMAPELLVAECANILWKKVARRELSRPQALLAARLLQASGIILVPTGALLEMSLWIALELVHPAYDCLYLALAVAQDCRFVTADEAFLRKARQVPDPALRDRVISLS